MKTIRIHSLKEIPFYRNLTLCLGFFDALHAGHRKLIESGKTLFFAVRRADVFGKSPSLAERRNLLRDFLIGNGNRRF